MIWNRMRNRMICFDNPEPGAAGPPAEGGTPSEPTSTTETPDFIGEFLEGPSGAGEAEPPTPAPAEPPASGEEPPAGEPPASEGSAEDALRQEIARMAGIMASHGITMSETAPATGEEPPAADPPATPTPAPAVAVWGEVVTISDEDFQNSLESKAAFEKILTSVRDQAVERVVQSIPQLVQNMVKQQIYMNELSREFYQANEDLAGIRPFVGVIANEIASKNPGFTPEQVLENTATAVRERLKLKAKAEAAAPAGPGPGPGLPNSTTRPRAAAPTLSGLEKELAELMEI